MRMFERLVQRVPAGHLGAGRRVYPGFLQIGGFMGMDPRRHLVAFRGMYRDLKGGRSEPARRTADFYDEYFAVLDIAAEFYLETLERVFKNHDLPRGEFYWRGRHVDPAVIGSALFTIEGALDDMCRPGQTEAAHALCLGIPASITSRKASGTTGCLPAPGSTPRSTRGSVPSPHPRRGADQQSEQSRSSG
jgi:polyhydroxyalkanoate depolymerase